jgi:hypothetical protein
MKDAISTIDSFLFIIGGLTFILAIVIYVLGEYGWLGFINPITFEQLISGLVSGSVIAFFTGLIFLIVRSKL